MIGIFTKQQNIERLDTLNREIKRLERKSPSEGRAQALEDAQYAAAELRQWLADIARIEG